MNNSILRNVAKYILIVVNILVLLAVIVNTVQLLKSDTFSGDALHTLYIVSTVIALPALAVGALALSGYATSKQPAQFSVLEYAVSVVALVGGVFLLLAATTPLIRTEVPKPDYGRYGDKYQDNYSDEDFYTDIVDVQQYVDLCDVVVVEPAVRSDNDEKYIRLGLKSASVTSPTAGRSLNELAVEASYEKAVLSYIDDAPQCNIAVQLGDEPDNLVDLDFELEQYRACNLTSAETVYQYNGTQRGVIKIGTYKPVRLPGGSSDVKEFMVDFSFKNYNALRVQSSMYVNNCPSGFMLSSIY
ncbi:hypothetical protein KC949_01855 [Candidatus Saccharibacteria bacterium]|nr:hypothetical protein [Candidatus Saccharibacteria bacterium]